MNPTDWQYTHQRQWESLDPRQRTDSREKTKNVPYCGDSLNDKRPHTMMGTNADLEHHDPSSHSSYRLNSNNFAPEQGTEPDSEQEELSKIDEELARKRSELQQIEKQILHKNTTNAMKTGLSLKAKTPCQMFKEEWEEDLSFSKVDSSVKNTKPYMSAVEKDEAFSCSKWSSSYNNRPLKERVKVIMQRQWPDGFLQKACSTPLDHLPLANPVEKTHTSTLNNDDHPLKLRVRALINRRLNVEVPDSAVKPHSSGQSPTATVVENNLIVNGFQRFLSVLNKGVDIEMLTKIVNHDNELPPTGQDLLQRDRRSCSKERKTELFNQDISNGRGKRNVQPEKKSSIQSDDRGSRHFGSSHRSRSPPVVEEKKPKLEQNQEQLQNILKTIGLSLDADDMCKLAERTQERLYGIKHETKQRLDSRGVSKRIHQHVQSDHSSSSSSTSVSDSCSSNSSQHQYSNSKTFMNNREQTQTPEYRRSRQKSTEQEREQDSNGDSNIICSRDGYPDPHPSLKDPEYHAPSPDAAFATPTYIFDAAVQKYNSDVASAIPMYNSDATPAIPTYNSVQHPEYTAYSNSASSVAWNCGFNVILPSPSYPPGFSNSLNPLCPSANTGALPGQVYPHPHLSAGRNNALGHCCFNADLSLSEGQTGQRSGPHYLHVINTGKSNGTGRCLTQVNKKQQRKMQVNKKQQRKIHQVQTSHLRSLCPEPPVKASTEVQKKKKTATHVINTQTQLNKTLHSGITSNTLRPVPPVEASTEVQQKKTATHVNNTQDHNRYYMLLNNPGTKISKTAKKKAKEIERRQRKMQEQQNNPHVVKKMCGKRRRQAEWRARKRKKLWEQRQPTDVQLQNIIEEIEQFKDKELEEIEQYKERELMTLAVAPDRSSANSQKDPAQMQTSNLPCEITTNSLHQKLPVEASTEVQQNKTATHVIDTQTSSGTARCLTQLTDMKIANKSVEFQETVRKQFQEMQRLENTARYIENYIRLAKSNPQKIDVQIQHFKLKKLQRRQRRIAFLREENKRELHSLLNSYPSDKSSTEAQQLEGDPKNRFPALNQKMEQQVPKPPAELHGEDTSEAEQMEGVLPTEEKKKLAAINQKMEQQVPKPPET